MKEVWEDIRAQLSWKERRRSREWLVEKRGIGRLEKEWRSQNKSKKISFGRDSRNALLLICNYAAFG